MESEILKAELKTLYAHAHNASRRFDEHLEGCYVCDSSDDEELCEYGEYYSVQEVIAWGYVTDHPLYMKE